MRYAWLEDLAGEPGGTEWLARLPDLRKGCAARWSLDLGEPFRDGYASLAIPATRRGNAMPVVLKIQFPHRECEHEAAALESWGGLGAALLLDHAPEQHALLLERCMPGTPLTDLPLEEALDVAVQLLPRLWVEAGAPFGSLEDEAAWWLDGLESTWHGLGRPFERRILDAAIDALTELPSTQGPQFLLHQDLHAGNVLRSEREPWLVIDPKPLTGEREFGIAALVRGDELGHGPREVRRRFDRLTAELALDRERARGWAIGQSIAWGIGEGYLGQTHIDVARWLLER